MFTTDKYVAIAYGNQKGAKLTRAVEEHWPEWVEEVRRAPWLRNWRFSEYFDRTKGFVKAEKLASHLLANAVWGFGVDGWEVEKAPEQLGHSNAAFVRKTVAASGSAAMKCILEMQKLSCVFAGRQYTWDETIFRECGAYVPCEFGTLDRWLEKYWA